MSLRNKLIANGFQPADVVQLTPDEQALLCMEDHVENVWSPAARDAARAARHKRSGLSPGQRKQVAQVVKSYRSKDMIKAERERTLFQKRGFGFSRKTLRGKGARRLDRKVLRETAQRHGGQSNIRRYIND